MKNYARLQDAVVVETIAIEDDHDIAELFHPDLEFVPCTAEVAQGWTRDGESWAALVVPLEHRKAAVAGAVNAKRDAIIRGGYRHNFGGTAGIRTLDQRDARDETAWLSVKLMAADMIAAGAGATGISIRDASNSTFTCSATVAASAMTDMGLWRSAVSERSWQLKDAIQAVTDQAELEAIDIEGGWPE